jgi:hypothetical protein
MEMTYSVAHCFAFRFGCSLCSLTCSFLSNAAHYFAQYLRAPENVCHTVQQLRQVIDLI